MGSSPGRLGGAGSLSQRGSDPRSVIGMEYRREVRDFLVSRRAKVTPEQVGLAAYGVRRVAGLRRGEVADLAGVSVEYYTQLERGNLRGASDAILEAIAGALLLDEAERSHLFDLARAAAGSPVGRAPSRDRVRPGVHRILDEQLAPAWVGNGRGDIVATNTLGRALNSSLFEQGHGRANPARFRFLDPHAAEYFRDWEATGRDTVAALRTAAAKNPYDRALTDLIGELSTHSEEFRTRWAAHDVRLHRTGAKRLHHPVVGDLDLHYEGLELPADPGQMLFVYTAEPGSPSQHALDLLATWATAPRAPASSGADAHSTRHGGA